MTQSELVSHTVENNLPDGLIIVGAPFAPEPIPITNPYVNMRTAYIEPTNSGQKKFRKHNNRKKNKRK